MKFAVCVVSAAAAAGVSVPALPAAADVVVLGASRDNTLYESGTGALSNGLGESLFAGNNGQNQRRRGVLMFDVAGAVPAGATVTGVELILQVTSSGTDGVSAVSLHRLLADWGEGSTDASGGEGGGGPSTPGSATWVHRFFDGQTWAAAGGDFAAAASASAGVGVSGAHSWSGAGMVADVQAWVDAPGSNYGWILVGDESTASSSKRFGSRENPMMELRPVLRVEYIPAPGVAAAGLGAAGVVLRRRRR